MLTAIILAKNEEETIGRCISSLGFCDEILVVDDNSADKTVNVAKKLKAKVISHQMEDYGVQRNWALDQVRSGWTLFVDADEVVSQELGASIQEVVKKNEANGYMLRRTDFIWNHKFKFGDVGNVWLTRLARKGAGVWVGTIHENWKVDGRVGKLQGDLNHYPHQTVVEFLKHINRYSTLKANQFYKDNRRTNIFEIVLGPIWRFIYLFFCRFGFLDGTAGFVHAMLMSFYMFLVSGKLYLRYNNIHGSRQAQSDKAFA